MPVISQGKYEWPLYDVRLFDGDGGAVRQRFFDRGQGGAVTHLDTNLEQPGELPSSRRYHLCAWGFLFQHPESMSETTLIDLGSLVPPRAVARIVVNQQTVFEEPLWRVASGGGIRGGYAANHGAPDPRAINDFELFDEGNGRGPASFLTIDGGDHFHVEILWAVTPIGADRDWYITAWLDGYQEIVAEPERRVA